jgi:4a-hydroxytetrahydrobiopterin dehydratase
MVHLLDQEEIDRVLAKELPKWAQEGDALVRSVKADSFMGGMRLVQQVAGVAEDLNHHPDIDIRWTTITFRLSTHSLGGITRADVRLAEDIDRLAD